MATAKPKHKQILVTLRHRDRRTKRRVRGYATCSPEFAVTPTWSNGQLDRTTWNITHVRTGCSVMWYLPSIRTAQLLTAVIAAFGVDWARVNLANFKELRQRAPAELLKWRTRTEAEFWLAFLEKKSGVNPAKRFLRANQDTPVALKISIAARMIRVQCRRPEDV